MSVHADDFKGFLEKYSGQLANANNLIIDYEDIKKYNTELAEGILNEPDIYLTELKKSTLNFASEEVDILIKNIPRKLTLQKLGSAYLGKLISINGIVSQVVQARPRIKIAAYRCSKSDKIIRIPQDEPFLDRPPRCGKGGGIAILLGHPYTEFIDIQELGIQERPENLKAGQVTSPVKLWITKKCLINGARAGDVVDVVGILKELKPTASTREITWDFYVDVVYIETINKDPSEIKITKDEEQQIIWLAQDPEIYNKIITSVAPSIYGHKIIKEAIMYQLFGGVDKSYVDRNIRGAIHILWIDEPSKAKSQMSMRVRDLALRGIYVGGGGASGAGLTAAIIWLKNKRPLLEAGALVIANRGICCIDEIEKMNKDDRVRIHEAMEQGIVNIQKAGHHYTLPANTSIFATGNPTFGRYDLNRTIKENISLPSTILSRFDLIFIGKGESDDVEGMTHHILKGDIDISIPISKYLLKKYIAYAKRIKPKLTEEAMNYLSSFYIKMAKIENSDSPIVITPRQLEGLIRLSEAHARIRLSEEIKEDDAKAAVNIMMESLKQAGIDPDTGKIDIDIIMTGIPKTARDKMSMIMHILSDNDLHSREEIVERMQERSISGGDTMKLLHQLLNDGSIYSPTEGFYKRTR